MRRCVRVSIVFGDGAVGVTLTGVVQLKKLERHVEPGGRSRCIHPLGREGKPQPQRPAASFPDRDGFMCFSLTNIENRRVEVCPF